MDVDHAAGPAGRAAALRCQARAILPELERQVAEGALFAEARSDKIAAALGL